MGIKYGSPNDYQGQVNRWLRRGTVGLAAGRSEAAAPVKLSGRRGSSGVGRDGTAGADGLPGVSGLSRGYKMWSRPISGTNTPSGYLISISSGSTIVTPTLATANDLQAVYRLLNTTAAGANQSRSMSSLSNLFQLGAGSGRGGFFSVFQFAFTTLPATRQWFVGMGSGFAGTPSSFLTCAGVGQDSGDTSPQFMHNDAAGTCTKTSSGLANVAVNTIYEARVFASPFSTNVEISIERLSGGTVVAGASYDSGASTNIPTGVVMSAGYYAQNGAGGGVMSQVFLGFYAELQPLDLG